MTGCRRSWAAAAALMALAPPAAGARAPAAGTKATALNRAVMADFVDLFYRQRRVQAAFTAHVAPDYIQHNPNVGDGRDAALRMLEPLFGMPGGHFDVQRVLVDGDYAVVHLRGVPDPAKPAVAVVDIYRLSAGRIVEHWDVVQPVPVVSANAHPLF